MLFMNLGWFYLAIGTVGEVVWVLTLKPSEGLSKLLPSTLNLASAFFNIWILSKAFNLLPTALSYAIWVGASAVAISVYTWFFQGESMSPAKIACIALIVVGVIGLKWVGTPG